MYNESIKAENKIITNDDLAKIFQAMGETLKNYQKVSIYETKINQNVEYMERKYSFKDEGSKMKVTVDFYDNTEITFDNYDNFSSIFYSRLDEIKSLDVHFSLIYNVITPTPTRINEYYYQSINMYIRENKLEISVKLSSQDRKLDEIYNLIKNTVLNAPEKYDMIIKKKNSITNTIALGKGMIPAIVISSLLLLVPRVNMLLLKGIVIYPICCFALSYIIGNILTSSKLDELYKPIVPEKKYAGYSDGHAIYKDDVDKFIGSSEILIGKKVKNLTNRNIIEKEYNKSKNLLSKELLILLGISIIVIIIGLFI